MCCFTSIFSGEVVHEYIMWKVWTTGMGTYLRVTLQRVRCVRGQTNKGLHDLLFDVGCTSQKSRPDALVCQNLLDPDRPAIKFAAQLSKRLCIGLP